jgi:predicted aspartyl protease
MSNGSPVVQATLNGTERVKLMVDTGAGLTFIMEPVIKRLGLKPQAADGVNVREITFNGVQARYVTFSTLDVGDLHYTDSYAITMEPRLDPGGFSKTVSREADGAIGALYLEPFPVLFDFQANQLTVWGSGPLTREDLAAVGMADATALPLKRPANGYPEFRVRVKLPGGLEEELVLDTGAAMSFISEKAARTLGLKPHRTVKDYVTYRGKSALQIARVTSLHLGP